MSALLGLLPFVFGAVAIVVYARAKRPIARSLGLNASRWSPLEVVIGLAITFVAIGLTLVAELALGAVRLEPGSLTWSSLWTDLLSHLIPAAAIEELLYRVLLLSGLAVVLSPVRGGRWIAVLLSAALFGAAHLGNPGASWVAAVGTGLGGGTYGPEAGIPGMLARFVVIALVVLYLSRRWPDGRFTTLRYAPEPRRRSETAVR